MARKKRSPSVASIKKTKTDLKTASGIFNVPNSKLTVRQAKPFREPVRKLYKTSRDCEDPRTEST